MNSRLPDNSTSRCARVGLQKKKPHEIALTVLFLILCALILLGVVIALATNERIWNELAELVADS